VKKQTHQAFLPLLRHAIVEPEFSRSRRAFIQRSSAGLAGAALASLPGMSQGADNKPRYGGRLRIAERFGSPGLDPHKNQEFMEYQNYYLMYNALTDVGQLPQVNIYPDVAKSWEISKDGREYVFPLREGIMFHHGKELDAHDVKYSMERVMNPLTRSPRAFAYRMVDAVTVIDKYHVKIRLKEPFGPFLSSLTIRNCPIIPAGMEPTPTRPAPGTGPFVFKSFTPNETTEFTRFDRYWEVDENTGNRLPYLDGIHIRKIPEEIVRWTALRAGDVDYIQIPPRKVVVDEQRHPTPGVVVMITQPVGVQWMYFNHSKPPFDNKKVRQAIAYGLDKRALMQAAYWGLAEPCNNQPFLNRSRMYVPVQDREVNPARARQLLAEAGYPTGLKTEIETTPPNSIACTALVGQLKNIGVDLTIKVRDTVPLMVSLRKGDYTIAFQGDSERLDPDDAYYMRFHPGEIGKNNFSRYSNKEMDHLVEQARAIWRWEDRVPFYKKVVELNMEDLAIYYVAKAINPIAWRDYVKGHGGGMSTWFSYHRGGMKKVWLDK
jgi:peptide/nickel transport system substrate-binding protein